MNLLSQLNSLNGTWRRSRNVFYSLLYLVFHYTIFVVLFLNSFLLKTEINKCTFIDSLRVCCFANLMHGA